MPPVLATVTAQLTASLFLSGLSIGIATFIAETVISLGVNLVLGAVTSSLSPKPKAPATVAAQLRDRSLAVRQPITYHRVVYGQVRVSGPYTFIHTTETNKYLHLVITLAAHEVEEIGDIYFNDELVPLDGSGNATGTYAGYATVIKGLGTANDSTLINALVTNTAGTWTTAHKQAGRAKIYVRLQYNQDLFASGIPNITAIVKGKKLYDPRTATTVYSANVALAVRDYLTDTTYGLGEPSARIDDAAAIVAANICDENVNIQPSGTEKRYTCNGTIETDTSPKEVIGRLLSAMAGICPYSGGKWRILAGAYRTPTITFDEDDLDGPVKVNARLSRRELFNAVKGVFVNPADFWQPTDFPPVTNATYLSEDQSERVWKDINLPYTTSASMSQRLAKITLEKARQQITVIYPCNLTGMRVQVGDVVGLTNTRFGWSSKAFEVVDWSFAVRDRDGSPHIGIDLVLRETASTVYDWSLGEETVLDPAPDTTLPNAFTVVAPTNVQCFSGTAELFVNGDGTVVSRIRVTWTDSVDQFVTRYEIQSRDSTTGEDYQTVGFMPADGAAELYINNVDDGSQYDVRVRGINEIGVRSSWTSAATHTVVGKTAPPADVTGFSAQENVASPWTGNVVTFRWTQVADVDLAGYELRYMASPFTWGAANVLTSVTRGTLITNAGVPPGTWVVGIKARDTSGNYSTNATTDTVVVTNTNDVLFNDQRAPNWRGVLSNMIVHPTRVLVPDSQTLASSMTDTQLWDTFVYNPYAEAYFEADEADIGLDVSDLRVWASNTGSIGPDGVGAFAPHLYIDYKLAAGSYNGFEHWDVGVAPARYIKARTVMDTSEGTYYISGFEPTYDVQEHTEAGTGTAAVGGTTITFADPFYAAPGVQLTAAAAGGAARFATYESLTGSSMVVRVFNSSGTDVGGAFNYFVTGA